jgi:hypothetical protein
MKQDNLRSHIVYTDVGYQNIKHYQNWMQMQMPSPYKQSKLKMRDGKEMKA